MCVCVCVCVHACVSACVCLSVCGCTPMCMHVCMRVCVCVCVCVCVYKSVCACMCVCMHVCVGRFQEYVSLYVILTDIFQTAQNRCYCHNLKACAKMPDKSYHRQLSSVLLSLCDVLISSAN